MTPLGVMRSWNVYGVHGNMPVNNPASPDLDGTQAMLFASTREYAPGRAVSTRYQVAAQYAQ